MSNTPVLLSWSLNGQPNSVMFDAVVSEMHTIAAQVTDHQVETGPDVADHIRPMPRRLSLGIVVTNTPIIAAGTQMDGATAAPGVVKAISTERVRLFDAAVQTSSTQQVPFSYNALVFSQQFDRVRNVYGVLVEAALGGALFSIDTSLVSYINFAITGFSVPRDVNNSSSIQGSIEFQEIRTVDTQVVTALPSQLPPKVATKKRGQQPPKEVTDTTQQSTLKAIANSAKAYLKSFSTTGGG